MAIALLAELARRLHLPYPVLLVLSGLALGFVPGVPAPTLDPDTFFFFFLPPLVYSEAFVYSTDDLKAHAAEIFLLAVGLVLATTLAVAAIANAAFGLPWAAAFVLGAVVGPTDPVSATAVIRRLGVSGRMVTILEGEALVNDGTALAIYRIAVGGAGAAGLSLGHALAEFLWVAVGGVAVGGMVAWTWTRIRRRLSEPVVEITFSLATPFAAYFPAERLGASGVLAAVTAGLVVGSQAHTMSAGTRLRREAFWEVLVFLLNSSIFLLVGLTFPDILGRLGGVPTGDLIWHAVVIAATVMVLRLAWMFLMTPVLSPLDPDHRWRPRPGELVVLGWSGMRGGVSLAAAMSIPVAAGGHPFPGRDEIVFLTYMVVLATLVVPGLTLGPLVRRLEVGAEGQQRRDDRARAQILRAALEHIDELARNDELPDEIAERLREIYESRLDTLAPLLSPDQVEGGGAESSEAGLRARRQLIAAQRAALAELESSHDIGSRAAREIERELDLEQREYS
ncbi:MAG: Na+/H+ antiporter [Solirubrobacterales bacterium]|nr:Na+/H+ antiporter [Solirubrobacterales bacterium]